MTEEYVVPADLLARCVGKKELVQKVLNAFIRQVHDDIPKLSSDLMTGDFEGAAKMAHRIKGSSANVAADSIRASAERIEQVAKDQQSQDIAPALAQLQEDWNQFLKLTAKFLA